MLMELNALEKQKCIVITDIVLENLGLLHSLTIPPHSKIRFKPGPMLQWFHYLLK